MGREEKVSQNFYKELWDKDTSKYKQRAIELAKRPVYPGLFTKREDLDAKNDDGVSGKTEKPM